MGDLERDTAVAGEDGRYTAHALRRLGDLGAERRLHRGDPAPGGRRSRPSSRSRPRSPSTTSPAPRFEEVHLQVRSLRRTRRAEAVAVSMTQGDRAIAEGLAWFVDRDLPGLEHDETAMPEVAGPEGLPTMVERQAAAGIESPFRFWDNLENRPLRGATTGPHPGPHPAGVRVAGSASSPTATFTDPLVDAARLVVVLDTMGWPAATQVHAWKWSPDGPPRGWRRASTSSSASTRPRPTASTSSCGWRRRWRQRAHHHRGPGVVAATAACWPARASQLLLDAGAAPRVTEDTAEATRRSRRVGALARRVRVCRHRGSRGGPTAASCASATPSASR